nr:hypothetical protein [Protofrankia symbiont of Coriaria ruscifolia]
MFSLDEAGGVILGEQIALDRGGGHAVAFVVGEEPEKAGYGIGQAQQQLVRSRRHADPLDMTGEAANVDRSTGLFGIEGLAQGRPYGVDAARYVGGDRHRGDSLAREVREVEAEVVEEGHPVLLHVVEELLLPAGARTECVAHDLEHARAARLCFDEELGDHRGDRRWHVPGERRPVRFDVGEADWWIPAGDRAGRGVLAHVEADRPAVAFVQVGGQEPGADPVGGGDGIPHLLGRARQLEGELHAQGDLGRCHEISSG